MQVEWQQLISDALRVAFHSRNDPEALFRFAPY